MKSNDLLTTFSIDTHEGSLRNLIFLFFLFLGILSLRGKIGEENILRWEKTGGNRLLSYFKEITTSRFFVFRPHFAVIYMSLTLTNKSQIGEFGSL